MITSYPDKNSLKEVLTNKLTSSKVRYFCQENGILLPVNNKDCIGKTAHLFFWGLNDINELSELIFDEKNYKKAIRFNVSKPNGLADHLPVAEEIFNSVGVIRDNQSSFSAYRIKGVKITNEQNSEREVLLEYEHEYPGKVAMLNKVTKQIKIHVKPNDINSVEINALPEDNNDVKVVQLFLNDIAAKNEQISFRVKSVTLDNLVIDNKIALFDRFFAYEFEDWTLHQIKGLKVNKQNELIEVDEDGDDNEDILMGINSAVLQGSSLRTNPFVQQCLSRRYYFTQAHIKFYHRRNAQAIVLEVSFKGNPTLLEVRFIQILEIEDGKEHKSSLSSDEQKEILMGFHDILYNIYMELVRHQYQPADN
ncbi:hypothetical protein [Petroclostridium sp. X23]|uniref:hypothetical protein n=1 Tax=Petroclostridium sp. X23 TaxID=3045146 RepID=UPI0024AD8C98|nr:hypothetical protein [Petroclostridium sp. X23]WHH59188.1 hypothetical protein QKW49_25940 [Petroclostridium sp. X23]